mmetsp:Transcript_23244/g.47146  ORF Transcript_23244/g.47146 Transcript_23244/m.47146 type:complete len:227 (-) Transcript_23244:952-1632(-)
MAQLDGPGGVEADRVFPGLRAVFDEGRAGEGLHGHSYPQGQQARVQGQRHGVLPHHPRHPADPGEDGDVPTRSGVRQIRRDPVVHERLRPALLPVPFDQGQRRPLDVRQRHQRRVGDGLLLGHGAVPPRPRLGRQNVHQLPRRDDVLGRGDHLLRAQEHGGPRRRAADRDAGQRGAAAGVRDQVLPLGDGVHVLHGHPGRQGRLLPLLGLPGLGPVRLHLPLLLPR